MKFFLSVLQVVNEKGLQLSQLTKCAYDYQVTVYTARGAKSTLSDDYQVHALVRYTSVTMIFGYCLVDQKLV